MSPAYYVPVLKAKQSELIAVRNLAPNIKPMMIPLFELQRREKATLLNRTLNQLERAWTVNLPLFLDVDGKYLHNFESEAIGNLVQILEHALSISYKFIPVTCLNRPQAYQDAIRPFSQDHIGLCIRLTNDDWGNIPELNRKLDDLISYFGVARAEADLIIDFGAFLPHQSAMVTATANVLINGINNIRSFRTLAVCATAFPANIKADVGIINYIPRSEWDAWLNLRSTANIKRKPLFGDYTIVHPEFPEGIVFIGDKIAPKIKYTADVNWLYIRGETGNWDDFTTVCSNLVHQPEYKGSTFSWGDQHIDRCAHNIGTTGAPQSWVTIGINHHITLVSGQCSSRP